MERTIDLNKKDYTCIERFAMVKAMHKKSLETAIAQKKSEIQII